MSMIKFKANNNRIGTSTSCYMVLSNVILRGLFYFFVILSIGEIVASYFNFSNTGKQYLLGVVVLASLLILLIDFFVKSKTDEYTTINILELGGASFFVLVVFFAVLGFFNDDDHVDATVLVEDIDRLQGNPVIYEFARPAIDELSILGQCYEVQWEDIRHPMERIVAQLPFDGGSNSENLHIEDNIDEEYENTFNLYVDSLIENANSYTPIPPTPAPTLEFSPEQIVALRGMITRVRSQNVKQVPETDLNSFDYMLTVNPVLVSAVYTTMNTLAINYFPANDANMVALLSTQHSDTHLNIIIGIFDENLAGIQRETSVIPHNLRGLITLRLDTTVSGYMPPYVREALYMTIADGNSTIDSLFSQIALLIQYVYENDAVLKTEKLSQLSNLQTPGRDLNEASALSELGQIFDDMQARASAFNSPNTPNCPPQTNTQNATGNELPLLTQELANLQQMCVLFPNTGISSVNIRINPSGDDRESRQLTILQRGIGMVATGRQDIGGVIWWRVNVITDNHSDGNCGWISGEFVETSSAAICQALPIVPDTC